jgi:hypothetical protein
LRAGARHADDLRKEMVDFGRPNTLPVHLRMGELIIATKRGQDDWLGRPDDDTGASPEVEGVIRAIDAAAWHLMPARPVPRRHWRNATARCRPASKPWMSRSGRSRHGSCASKRDGNSKYGFHQFPHFENQTSRFGSGA